MSAFALLGRLGKVGWSVLGIGGAGAAVDVAVNPKDGVVANVGADIVTTWANIQTEAGVDTGFQGFYKFFEKLAEFIESFAGEGTMSGMTNWARQGMGETELTNPSSTSGGDGSATVIGGAADDTLGSITYTPTAENELTLENFSNFDGALSGENLLHKANVFAHGVAEGGVHVVNLVGHSLDASDWLIGKGASLFGIDTGYEERNISESMHDSMMDGVDGAWTLVGGGPPELKTAWDRAVHFGGEMVPALATGYAAAPALSGAFAGIATAPAVNAVLGTTLGNAFTAAVTGLGLTSTGGIVLNSTIVASTPALNHG